MDKLLSFVKSVAMSLRKKSVIPVTTALAAVALAAPPARADTSVPCDPGALVQAVAAANASATADTLSLAPGCVYTLTTPADPAAGLPAISGTLTVNGNHATIARAQNAPRFRIIDNWGDLTLNQVTITGGHATDGVGTDSYGEGNPGQSGGGIRNWGPLTIIDSIITGNTAGAGAPGADATATTRAGRGGLGGFGGGIASYWFTPVTMTITNSQITNNTTGAGGQGGNGTDTKPGAMGGSGGYGGGIDLTSGTVLRMTGSNVTGNRTAAGAPGGTGGAAGGGAGDGGSGGSGAGIFVSTDQGNSLHPTITKTKIAGNEAGQGGDAGTPGPDGYPGWSGFGGSGGGLSVFYDTLTLNSSTITENIAGGPGAGSFPLPASGGGIHTLNGQVTLTNDTTVTANNPNNCDDPEAVPGCTNPQPARHNARLANVQKADAAAASQEAASRK
jgi:hypothetical protein